VAEVHKRSGRIQLFLDADERKAIAKVVEQLSPQLGRVPRTSPIAYEDTELQAEYERWVRPEIERGREADLDVVRDCVGSDEDVTPLTEAQALAWTRALNHLRLAAGGVLGIDADGWEERADRALRRTPEFRVLIALALLQEELVAALEG
jgi:hypothetical protein